MQTTPINLTLKAADWEAIIGIISVSADPDIQDLVFQLATYYKGLVTKPILTADVTVITTEETVVKLSTFLYGNTVMNVAKDSGASTFTRVMTAIRAANNAADNYISTQLAAQDTKHANVAASIRKNGRATIMVKQFDNV